MKAPSKFSSDVAELRVLAGDFLGELEQFQADGRATTWASVVLLGRAVRARIEAMESDPQRPRIPVKGGAE